MKSSVHVLELYVDTEYRVNGESNNKNNINVKTPIIMFIKKELETVYKNILNMYT